MAAAKLSSMLGKLLKKAELAKKASAAPRPEDSSLLASVSPHEKPSSSRALPLAASPRPARANPELLLAGAGRVVASTAPMPESSTRGQEASFLGAGVQLRGALASSGGLVLNCRFLGTVYAPEGIVWIGPEADVRADIRTMDLQVEGKVRGSLSVQNSLDLRKGADVQGSIRCLRLQIAEEAVFRGPCECFPPEPSRPGKTPRGPDLYGFFMTARIASVRI
ncbi:polymer-forming cytoskeletal protein [Methylacidimicrobium sp. B4]|uniref:bactofilin family protein n=1 Tax=Methylacidimicrobium sp. B4 TaxID=2796139 RepID=UPI001A8C1B9D|nr:polymer-forming cytoskeletal protein [Methylacidimicrobium sp. B4]QSR84745.1 polymer-forming cytoskeletal protein [Methylacidimicrobium sp. B4]